MTAAGTPRTLAAGETAVFDLQKIRDRQMKDYANRALPASASIGQFRWAVRGVTDGKIVLIGRAEMVSLAEGISTSYSCPMDCGPWYHVEVTYPPEVAFGMSGVGTAMETASWNYGYTMGPYPAIAGWSVDTPVVSFDPSGAASTTISGDQVGQGNLLAFIGWQQRYDWDGLNCVDLGTYAEQGGGPVQTVCAVPNNFHQVGSGTASAGVLTFSLCVGFQHRVSFRSFGMYGWRDCCVPGSREYLCMAQSTNEQHNSKSNRY